MVSRVRKSHRGGADALLELWGAALDELGGAVLLLDPELRIMASTEQADELLGTKAPIGERAPHLLCGRADQRPIAEALSRGEAALASVLRETARGTEVWNVSAVPLRRRGVAIGYVLLLSKTDTLSSFENPYGILTRSDAMLRLLEQLKRVARSSSAVLVRGDTGTGKELVARAVHRESSRHAGPFLAINCAALPPELLESELFGHVRGAFTGAVRDTLGYFRRAHGGTLFLDEVAELPLALQAKLLRVTQERVVVPVGGTEPFDVDVRIVSATHRSLREEVREGRFRADLMYRLRVLSLFLPPLRARPEDIELLAWHFLARLQASPGGRDIERISRRALEVLTQYSWPGNVRELENAIEYAFVMGDGPTLTEGELPGEVRGQPETTREGLALGELDPALPPEAKRLLTAIERADGHRERAAQSLGMSRTTLWRKLKGYGLE